MINKYFLAKMNIPAYLKNFLYNRYRYTEIEGIPPIIFKGNGENLIDYRIYGASGGVGDRTENLFDFGEWSKNINANRDNSLVKGIDGITITANSNDAFTIPYAYTSEGVYKIYVKPNTNYLLSWVSNNNLYGRVFIFKNGIPDNTHIVSANNNITKYLLFGTDADTEFITLRFGVETTGDTITYSKIMLNEGSTALPYEPYGYKVPVVVSGKNLLSKLPNSRIDKGIEYTNVNNLYLHIEGTSNAVYSQTLSVSLLFKKGKYYINFYCDEQYKSKLFVLLRNNNNIDIVNVHSSGASFELNNDETIKLIAGVKENNTTINTNMYIQIVSGITSQSTYEPYIEPTTTTIYLDEPIGENESISLSDTNVNIPTIKGTNVLTVDTTVQPSKVLIKI